MTRHGQVPKMTHGTSFTISPSFGTQVYSVSLPRRPVHNRDLATQDHKVDVGECRDDETTDHPPRGCPGVHVRPAPIRMIPSSGSLGGLIGAGSGAAIGAAAVDGHGAALGAAIGGAVGALGGLITTATTTRSLWLLQSPALRLLQSPTVRELQSAETSLF